MEISVDQAEGKVGVTILSIQGDMDGSNYQGLIDKGREAHSAGAQHILVDMSEMPFMSSAGLIALHSLILLAQDKEPPNPKAGWSAFHALSLDRDSGLQQHVKLLNPQPPVDSVLEKTGMKDFFEIHTDLETAIDSF